MLWEVRARCPTPETPLRSPVRLPRSLLLLLLLSAPAAASADSIHRDDVMAWLEVGREADTPAWPDGTVLRGEELEALRSFLPPGFFAEQRFVGARFAIQATRDYPSHPSYRKATLQFSAQTSLGPGGEIENYVAGLPFAIARIEAAPRERAGLMAAWNRVYRWQHYGYRSSAIDMYYLRPGAGDPEGDPLAPNPAADNGDLLGGGQVERVISQFYQRVYLRHLAMLPDRDYALGDAGSAGLFYKDYLEITAPFDMKDTRFVIERSDDAREEDQVYSYLPTQRRVRRISPVERADRFLGSELNFDDFEGFSGRVLDYHWTYLGRRRVFAVIDAASPRVRYYGPRSRVPLDRWQFARLPGRRTAVALGGHPYGSKLLFLDAQTYNLGVALVFDRDERLWKINYVVYQWPEAAGADPPPELTVLRWRSTAMVNFHSGTATVAVGGPTDTPAVSARDVRRLFSVSNLTGGR